MATLEDKTFTGEISRELVAQVKNEDRLKQYRVNLFAKVMIEAALDPLSSNKVIMN